MEKRNTPSVGSLCQLGLLIGLLVGLEVGAAYGFSGPADPPHFGRRTETGFRIGAERRVNLSQIWQPLWQLTDRLVFLSLRSSVDNLDNFEGNLGLGYRQFTGNTIYGGYVYADRRATARGSIFYQGTLGAEYIRPDWEMRANVYAPVHALRHYADFSSVGLVVAGTGIGMREPGTIIEEAQPGVDIEAGFVVPDTADFLGQVRVYGGAYVFLGQETPDVIGARSRIEADVTGWMKLGARAQYDAERGGQYMLEATFRWPKIKTAKTHGLWARLGDTPERDIDIVTGGREISGPVDPMVDTTTGAPVRILYVDNTARAGGNGSAETPFSILTDGMAAVQTGDILYVRSGDGSMTGYDQGVVLNADHITLAGSGAPLVLDGARYRTGLYQWEGDLLIQPEEDSDPLITNTAGDVLRISGDFVTLRGVHVDGGLGHGLVIEDGANHVTIEDVKITGQAGNGILIQNTSAPEMNIRVRNTLISGNLLAGIRTQTSSGDVNLDLGQPGDYGFNDVFGNIGDDLIVQTSGALVPALGNYWGGGVLTRRSGTDLAIIDSDVYVADSFCDECHVQGVSSESLIDVMEGTRVQAAPEILSGFTGHRYVRVAGEGVPEWIQNGVNTHSDIIRVAGGDTVSVFLQSTTLGYGTRFAQISGSGVEATVSAQTRFLPNIYNTLIGWWDARDLDGDFETGDQPSDQSVIAAWSDKTGNGHTATTAGSARPVYAAGTGYLSVDGVDDEMQVANSFFLSALNNGATLAAVMYGVPAAEGATLFSYGTCTGGAGSRCFKLSRTEVSDDLQLRLDTSGGLNQGVLAASSIFDGAPHFLWVSAAGNGNIVIRQDGANVITGSYVPGGSFWNTNGLNLVGPIQGGYGEILLFNGVPSDTARGLIESYLTEKWDL